ncbi:unnamed protein product, partial [Prorocentrum cordatum]
MAKWPLGASDFPRTTREEFERFIPHSDPAYMEKRPAWTKIFAVWTDQAHRSITTFCLFYGQDHERERRGALRRLAQLNLDDPNQWTEGDLFAIWEELHWDWWGGIRLIVQRALRDLRNQNPTEEEFRLHLLEGPGGQPRFQMSLSFQLDHPNGFFRARDDNPQCPIGTALEAEEHKAALAGVPKNPQGKRICIPFNCHSTRWRGSGCRDARQKINDLKGLPMETRLLFFRFGGFHKLPLATPAAVDARMAALRKGPKPRPKTRGGQNANRGTETPPGDPPTTGRGEPEQSATQAPAPGVLACITCPRRAARGTLDFGQYLHPTGPHAHLMREKLGLQEGEPEGGQCMLLSTAASSLWRQHGTPPHQEEVRALATRYRAELLEAAGDAPPASSSPLDDAFRAGAAVPHSGRDYREFPLLGGPALTSVDLHACTLQGAYLREARIPSRASGDSPDAWLFLNQGHALALGPTPEAFTWIRYRDVWPRPRQAEAPP